MRNRLYPRIGILCGLLSVIFAIVLFAGGGSGVKDMDTGSYTSYNYYGGDAYTGIQQAAADTSRNVQALARIVRTGFQGVSGSGMGFLLLIVGLALIAWSLHTLDEMAARDRFEAKVLASLQGAVPVAEDVLSPNEKTEEKDEEENTEEPAYDPDAEDEPEAENDPEAETAPGSEPLSDEEHQKNQ